MKSRYTCWARDRIIILGLLAGEMRGNLRWSNPTWPIPTFTRKLPEKVGWVGHRGFMHNQTPVSEEGLWSWCPSSIYDLEDNSDHRDREHALSAAQRTPRLILQDGVLLDRWDVRKLLAADQKTLVPYAAHDYQFFRGHSALQRPSGHFLLSVFHVKRILERYVLVRWLDESPELSQLLSQQLSQHLPQHGDPKLAPQLGRFWMFRFVGTVLRNVNEGAESFVAQRPRVAMLIQLTRAISLCI